MFNWFRKKQPILRFETNEAAFEHCCLSQHYPPLLEALIPALVVEKGDVDPEGVHHFLVRLPDVEGGRNLWTTTLKEATAFPEVGDLVGFRVVKIASDLPSEVAVIGYIAVKLAPVWVDRKGWRVQLNYTPSNIKPTVRW